MKKSVVVPLVMLASIATLTACTKPEMAPAPAPVTPVETVAPVTPEATPAETPAATAETTTQVVQYQSPGGRDEIEFTVTVENGVITAASAKPMATNDGSIYNQGNFVKALDTVVGKSVAGFDVDVIGGASLTTAAFENFVQSL